MFEVIPVVSVERDATVPWVATMGAGGWNKQITEDPAEWVALSRGDGRADRVVVGGGQQRQVVPVAPEAGIGGAIGPVVVDDVAEAQVLDPGTSPVDQRRDRPGQPGLRQHPGGVAGQALERCSEVGCSEVEDVAHGGDPWFLDLLAVVAGAAGNQSAHGAVSYTHLRAHET